MISLPQGNICRIQELEMSSINPTASAFDKRERYAKTTLAMFLPFRKHDDLLIKTDNRYWSKLMKTIQDGSIWKTGIDILHNIEERETAHKMKSATEPLSGRTKYEAIDDEEIEDGQNEVR